MTRTASLLALPFLIAPAPAALAAATPDELLDAMDVVPEDVVPGSPAAAPYPGMFSVQNDLGPAIQPWEGPDFAILSTGDPDGAACQDVDWGPTGEAGDEAVLTFELVVPPTAHSLHFHTYFLSEEYPEWVGSPFNDTYSGAIWSDDENGFSGEFLFDSFGNPITVNSAFFSVINPPGNCFSEDGGTGWIAVALPVVPNSRITLEFRIWDVEDGVFDSWAVLDDFAFSEGDIDEPIVDPVPDEPLRIGFVSPKEGPVGGGGQVSIFGHGFDETTVVTWGGVEVDVTIVGGEHLRLDEVPPGDAGSIDVAMERADGTVAALIDAYTYYDPSDGVPRPAIASITPHEVWPEGGTVVTAEATGVWSTATAAVVDDAGQATDVEIQHVDGTYDNDQTVYLSMPPHAPGWASLVLTNHSDVGDVAGVGYPVHYTWDAVDPGGDRRGPGGCSGCAMGSSTVPASLALLPLLGLALRRRRAS